MMTTNWCTVVTVSGMVARSYYHPDIPSKLGEQGNAK